jgi:alcohol dehydrogenase
MNSGDGPTNGFAYYFGVKDKIPHGLAGAIFLKEVMKWNFTNGYKEYYKFSLDDVDDKEQKNNKLFEELDELYIKLDIPNLSFYGYEASSIEDLVNNTAGALEGSFSGNPIQFNEQSIKEVLFKLI